jgi:hypothetical protein
VSRCGQPSGLWCEHRHQRTAFGQAHPGQLQVLPGEGAHTLIGVAAPEEALGAVVRILSKLAPVLGEEREALAGLVSNDHPVALAATAIMRVIGGIEISLRSTLGSTQQRAL